LSKKNKNRANRTVTGTLNTDITNTSALAWFVGGDATGDIYVPGYTSLAHNPEIMAAVGKIARLIGSMTIHLMANQKGGDVRIKNELAKHVDIYPNKYMTRQTWMSDIVRTMLLDGNGNAVVIPLTQNGMLGDMVKMPPGYVSFVSDGGYGYKILINGRSYDPENLLHFVANPNPNRPWQGEGYKVSLKNVADNLKQAAGTEKAFMSSKWKPSLVVKVDGMVEEFSNPEGRSKLLKDYISTNEDGEPWLVPAGTVEIEQVKPLSLADLALADSVTLDKKTVAAILDVPAFLVGAGDYDPDQWNNFISTTIGPLATGIQQELTRKLLLSPDWYFKFNVRSLYSYDLQTLATVYDDQYVRGICTGNEVRDVLGMTPKDGLDELVMLENYIPRGMIGDQKKLNQNQGGTQ
jgi:HK97 family phage portal protein